VNVHCWQVVPLALESSMPVPLAFAQPSGWTSVALLTLVIV
jgi:hypothetical protein